MEWPQIVMIILLTTRVVASACWHGQNREINCAKTIFNIGIDAAILYAGGFWG